MDLFKIINLVSGGMASVADLYSSLERYTEWESDRQKEREDH
jgi:hypothetical protein